MILLYCTCKDLEEAKRISKILIDKKLAACTNMFPVSSMYVWKGKLADDQEVVMIAKTLEEKKELAIQQIKKLHSYATPCILALKAEPNKEYFDWMNGELG
jgi:periplasmic divalent cation tolerance protein